MLAVVQILTVAIVSVAMAASLAHALELPGKMRLAKDEYFAVQRIYYPGFTFAGISEPAGVLASLVLLFLTPQGTATFWLTVAALLCLVIMQIVFWLFVQPVNKVWLRNEPLNQVASHFFSLRESQTLSGVGSPTWTTLRNRWEYAHLARAVLAMTGFLAMLIRLSF